MLIHRTLKGGPFDGTTYSRDAEADPPPRLSVQTKDGHAVYRLDDDERGYHWVLSTRNNPATSDE